MASPRWWHWSWLIDWTLCAVCIALGFTLKQHLHQEKHMPTGQHPSYALSSVTATVKTWHLLLITYIPAVPLVALAESLVPGRSVSVPGVVESVHAVGVALTTGLGITLFTCDILKAATGQARPDLFARCWKQTSDEKWSLEQAGFPQCDLSDGELDGAFQSFPSSAAALAFFAMTFLALWLACTMRVFRTTSPSPHPLAAAAASPLLQLVLPLGCWLVAWRISVTRVTQHKHFAVDIVAGCLIGCVYAVVLYFAFFSSNGRCRRRTLPHAHSTQPCYSQSQQSLVALRV